MYRAKVHLDKFCRETVQCENYIEWEYDYVLEDHNIRHESTMTCVSCQLSGQSMNIEDIPDECPHHKAAKEQQAELEALQTWYEVMYP